MNPSPFELQQTIELHRQALWQEAERERLLEPGRFRRLPLRQVLARTGRLMIAVGTWLEARYAGTASAAPVHPIGGQNQGTLAL